MKIFEPIFAKGCKSFNGLQSSLVHADQSERTRGSTRTPGPTRLRKVSSHEAPDARRREKKRATQIETTLMPRPRERRAARRCVTQPEPACRSEEFSTRPAVFPSSARVPPLLPARSLCYRKLPQRQAAPLGSVALPGAGQLFCYVAVISIFHVVACHVLIESVRLRVIARLFFFLSRFV